MNNAKKHERIIYMKRSARIAAGLIALALCTACAEAPSSVTDVSTGGEVQSSASESAAKQSPEEAQTELKVYFSCESGFYDSPIELEMSCPAYPDGKIFYTTDGSTPDASSTPYTEKITLKNRKADPNVLAAQTGTSAGGDYIPKKKVDKANIIRAVVILPDGTTSEIASKTYFIGLDREKKYSSVPVISLMTDFENLYDHEKGIYILGQSLDNWLAEDPENKNKEPWEREGNYSQRGREWERPVAFELITADGSEGISQDMGMRIMGAASRSATQKSLRLIAREDYGKKNVKYPLIPDNMRSDGTGEVEKYKSFVLRNGGNDCDYAKLRDPLFQQFSSGRRFETQQFAPCVVYLNGEYWGMYTLVEDYNDNYIENNYGIDNKNVVIIKRGEIEEGEEADISLYHDMFDFITSNDMSIAENYAKAEEMLDMGSYADYCALNFYIHNYDSIFKDNNWRMWRVRTPDDTSDKADGKWRMMVYDTDYSAGIYDGGRFGDDNISPVLNGTDKLWEKSSDEEEADETVRQPADMFRSLMANGDFRRELIISLCDIRNYDFEGTAAVDEVVRQYEVYGKLVPPTFDRFGPEWLTWNTDKYYEQKIGELANFLDGRYNKFPEIMQKAFGLGDIANAEISVSGNGFVTVNNTPLPSDRVSKGKYFTDYTVTVRAEAGDGAVFKEWKCTGCTVSDSTSPEAEISFTGDFAVEAVFE